MTYIVSDSKKKTWFALGLFVVVFFLMMFFTVVPLVNHYFATAAKIKNLKFQIEHYSDKITSHASVVKQVNNIKDQLNAAGVFSAKSSIHLAQAEIQQRVQQILSGTKAELNSIQSLTPTTVGGLVRYGINVRFAARMQDLLDIFYAIETNRPYMVIEVVKIISVKGERNLRTGKVELTDKVYVSIDVFSYLPDMES